MKKIITHSGSFHADDVMAVAMLSILLDRKGEKYEIFRSRDPKVWEGGDYVVDVGGVYNPEAGRYDHHQIGGAGKRENGSPYSSVGLVWKHHGMDLVHGDKEVWDAIDKNVVTPLDLGDNGIETYTLVNNSVRPYLFHDIVSAYRARWDEEETTHDNQFLALQPFVKTLVLREIDKYFSKKRADGFVKDAYEKAGDKRLVILDKNYPWEESIQGYPEPLFVVAPRIDGSWQAKTIPLGTDSFSRRKYFPQSWAGKTNEAFSEAAGITDGVFCHNNLFIAVAKSKEGAITLAKKALEA